MHKIFNPHDRFFRQSLSDLKIAKDFFEAHLPRGILAKVDLDSLFICKESYIDEELKEYIDDIVYRVNIEEGQQGYIYLALEHQSTAKHLMAFRFIKYQLAIIDNHLKQHPNSKYLPLVFPLLYYHGIKTPYPEPTDFFDLFSDKDLAREFFLRPLRVIDTNRFSDEEIKTHKLAGLLELVQKHIYDRDFLLLTNQLKELIMKIATEAERDHLLVYLDNTLYYIMKKAEISDKVKFKEALDEIPLVKEESIMSTMAEQWVSEGFQKGIQEGKQLGIQEGKQQGIQEGKQQGIQEGIKLAAFKMLQAGMCCSEIAKITGLSKTEIGNLDNKHECNH